jgi:tetratricopeptide (TPR) repeat protein
VNEYIPVLERIQGPIELKEAIQFIADEREQTKVPLQSGERINYLPSRRLKLTIDKDAVIRSGAVPESMRDLIVDQIVWEVKQNGLYKNDLMLLDLLATNNWQRPIYFANPNSVSKVLDADKYCHMEGVVFRFLPVVAPEYYRNMGGVNAEASYDILVNQARWGNLHKDNVTVDRESYRNSALAKQSYMRTAQALINLNRKDSAIRVLDKSLEFFPHNKITFDFYMLPWVDLYFDAGAPDKAINIMRTLSNRYLDDLEYYNRIAPRFSTYYERQTQEALAVIQRLSELARQKNLEEFSKELENALDIQLKKMGL